MEKAVHKKIGVTGGFAVGKSSVSFLLDQDFFNADHVVAELLDHELRGEVLRLFGLEGVGDARKLNPSQKQEIARRIYRDPILKRKLEELVHPPVVQKLKDYFAASFASGKSLAVAEVPLLIEAGLQNLFDVVVVVVSSLDKRRQRAAKRGYMRQQFERIVAAQVGEAERLKFADFVIHNNGSLEDLARQVEILKEELHG
jgi:dephospho-CoA kinase